MIFWMTDRKGVAVSAHQGAKPEEPSRFWPGNTRPVLKPRLPVLTRSRHPSGAAAFLAVEAGGGGQCKMQSVECK